MKVIHDLRQWREIRPSLDHNLGFVPTMGALHAGHLSLVKRSLQECNQTVVSIFVNPTQFDDPKDLEAYPQTLQSDQEMLSEIDYLLAPPAAQMYPAGYRYRVREEEISGLLCGAHRPGHFDGMLTVVLKLLNLVTPRKAYFGEKDFQQLELVKGMVEDFFLPVEIVACPTQRESDGLAMSSRNQRLSPSARVQAGQFARLLGSQSADPDSLKKQLEKSGFEVDYVEEWRGRRLAAVRLGSVRLIDNIPLLQEVP